VPSQLLFKQCKFASNALLFFCRKLKANNSKANWRCVRMLRGVPYYGLIGHQPLRPKRCFVREIHLASQFPIEQQMPWVVGSTSENIATFEDSDNNDEIWEHPHKRWIIKEYFQTYNFMLVNGGCAFLLELE
jgi:hypothetical protein